MPPEKGFYQSDLVEPHAVRRKLILEKHPEIEALFGYDNRPIPYVIAITISHLLLAHLSNYMSWPVFILMAWGVGGASSHALSLMTHEVSHNLVFESAKLNEYFGILCNVGMGVPSASMFKR